MKINRITGISLLLIILIASCSEPEAPKSDPFYDRLKEGDVTSNELDSLMEANGVGFEHVVCVPQDRFEVTFPVNKKHVKKEVTKQILDGEEIKTYEYKANMQYEEDDNLAYQIAYNYVGELKTEKEIKQLFDEQRDYWISAGNAELEYENVVELNGAPGRDLYLTIDGSKVKTHNRMYYDRGIFYRLTVVTPEGNLFNKSIKVFLDSFKVLDK